MDLGLKDSGAGSVSKVVALGFSVDEFRVCTTVQIKLRMITIR